MCVCEGKRSTPLKDLARLSDSPPPTPPPDIGTHRDPHRVLLPLQLTASDVWRKEREEREEREKRKRRGSINEKRSTQTHTSTLRHKQMFLL